MGRREGEIIGYERMDEEWIETRDSHKSLSARFTQISDHSRLSNELMIGHKNACHYKDAVAYWLVCWTPDRAIRVRALAGALVCVLGQDTLHSQFLSQPWCINGHRRI